MSTTAPPPETAVEVREADLRPDDVWGFFYEIADAENLNPAEEKQTPYEAVVDGEVVGMAVVDTIPRQAVHVSRVAVLPDHRRRGVATALLEHIAGEHGAMTWRVRTNNDASLALSRGFGAEESDSRWPSLRHFEYDPEGSA